MIIYALIVRHKDGLALTASTDFNDEGVKNVKESKRYLKLLAKKAYQFPDRCVLNTGSHNVYLQSSLGVSYLALCESTYPTVLSFSFLNELMKEFLSKYQVLTVNQARRPYTFIDFNNIIHVARQRYNKPHSLTTRINLAELSEEIRLRPPQIVTISEIQPINGYPINGTWTSVGPKPKLERLSWLAWGSITLSFMLSAIDILRSSASWSFYGLDDLDGPSVLAHGLIFLLEAAARTVQVGVLLVWGRKFLLASWCSFAALAILGYLVWGLRDGWQNGLRIFVTACTQWCITQRKLQMRLPNYNV